MEQDLAHLSNLTSLELGGNRISDLEGLDSLYQLEELWLGRNRIEAISSLGRYGRPRSSQQAGDALID